MRFLILYFGIALWLGVSLFHVEFERYSALSSIIDETAAVLAVAAAAAILARIEGRHIRDFNIGRGGAGADIAAGAAGGFLALSLLVLALHEAGFLRFGGVTLGWAPALGFGLLWAVAFLLVGLTEEGSFRGYLLFTLTRGVNFWWAAGGVGTLSFATWLNRSGNGSAGVYLAAAMGLLPSLWVHLRWVHHERLRMPGFWYAAWFTSVGFGYVHTFNTGESWLGIFSASAIGFVFCVSVRLTGSAWWAIGFHSAWDWTQTFFYGTPDSGVVPQGHFLTTTPAGPALWSGGKDGPEGSILVLPVVVVTLLAVLLLYRRRHMSESPSTAVEAQLS
jgi:hypothetical protein